MKLYFGCGGLLLKIHDRNTDTLGFEPTGMSPMGLGLKYFNCIELKTFMEALRWEA